MEFIELVKNCKLVRTGSERNGHDCYGNYEWTLYKYVVIEGEIEICYDDWYVIHDGTNVIEVVTEDGLKWREEDKILEKEKKEHLEKTGFETIREYEAYLKGKNEVSDILPNDVMDYIAKSGAWLNNMVDNDRDDIRQKLIRHNDRLLEKYNFKVIDNQNDNS